MSYGATDERVALLQGQVDEEKQVLAQTLRTARGDGEVEILHGKADYLNQNADMFQRTTPRVKRKLWWQNIKLWIILIIIILVILTLIIITVVVAVVTTREQ